MKNLTEKDIEFLKMLLHQNEIICLYANNHLRNHQHYEDKSGERYFKDLGIKLENLRISLFEKE